MAVRARSMGAVGGNRGRCPMNEEEEVEERGLVVSRALVFDA